MKIEECVNLADKNWFGTGGKAQFFCQPKTFENLVQATLFAQQQGLEIVIIGQGANMLISDEGFNGLVMIPAMAAVTVNPEASSITADAGASLHEVIEQALAHNLLGLEVFSGIPGSIGGSVYINVHYFEALLGDFLVQAHVFDCVTQQLLTVDKSWFNFGYNTSTLHDRRYVLVDATLQLQPCTPLAAAYARGRRDEIIRHRVRRYPSARTCGSFFRNFYPHELLTTEKSQQPVNVAYYLDRVGVRGELQHGGAKVSWQHANMLVTEPGAASADVIAVARTMQELVMKKFNLKPQPECQFIGFKDYPLL